MNAVRVPFPLLLAFLLAASTLALAAKLPYDDRADAHADIRAALADAAPAGKPVLLVFGANWCEDCRALDAALSRPDNAAWLAREFRVVKVDVGRFDRNLDIATGYGGVIDKGIPSAVIVSPQNKVLFATRAGELADARGMSESGIRDFFTRALATARAAK